MPIPKARELMEGKKLKAAIAELEKALLYLENLEVGKPTPDGKNAMIYYYVGNAYNQMGNAKQAKANFQKSTESRNGYGMDDLLYFQGKSLEKLGQEDKAKELFDKLIAKGAALREEGSNNSLIAV